MEADRPIEVTLEMKILRNDGTVETVEVPAQVVNEEKLRQMMEEQESSDG